MKTKVENPTRMVAGSIVTIVAFIVVQVFGVELSQDTMETMAYIFQLILEGGFAAALGYLSSLFFTKDEEDENEIE